MPPSHPDFGEDIAHQRVMWRIERGAWTLITLALLAALAGFAGHGLFSERRASADGGLVLTYQRFERYHAQTQLALQLTEIDADSVRIRLGSEFVRNVEIMRIEPEPARAELGTEFITYEFDAQSAGTILVHYRPMHTGALRIAVARDDAQPLSLPLFVWP